jgi:Uma2 family endonuclease
MSTTITLAQPPAPFVPPLLTAEEFVRRYENQHKELIGGVVREVSMTSTRHGKMCFLIARAIGNHVMDNDLGHIMTNDSFIPTRRGPDSVRGPDVCYYSYDRLPKGPVPGGLLPMAPNLVVEVRSPSETWTDIFSKVAEYLTAGVQIILVLDDETSTVSVYRTNVLQQTLHIGDQLTLPDVLPGFTIPVEKLLS